MIESSLKRKLSRLKMKRQKEAREGKALFLLGFKGYGYLGVFLTSFERYGCLRDVLVFIESVKV